MNCMVHIVETGIDLGKCLLQLDADCEEESYTRFRIKCERLSFIGKEMIGTNNTFAKLITALDLLPSYFKEQIYLKGMTVVIYA